MLSIHPPPQFPMYPSDHLRRRDRPASTRQYAIPAKPISPHHSRAKSTGLTYTQHELLRQRKTPNGLLLEHDSPSVDKAVPVPASKHVLLSSPPDLGPARRSHLNQVPQTPNRDGPYMLPYGYGSDALRPDCRPYLQPPAWDFPGGLDSVLNQTLPMQPSQRYYLHPGTRIPTVLPSAFHSSWGPTASAGPGPYGPYWPDGTFTPYRPASIRDNRYFAHRFEQRQPLRDPFLPPLAFPQLRRPGRLPTPFMTDPYYASNPSQQHFQQNNAHQSLWHHPNLSQHAQQGPHFADTNIYQPLYPQTEQPYQHRPTLEHRESVPLPQAHRPLPLQPGPESDQIAFRDRTFTWANKIYAELLATIQRTGKDTDLTTVSHGKSASKLSIFPKPPKRSGAHFLDSTASSDSERKTSQLTSNISGDKMNDVDSLRPQTAIWAPSRRAPDFEKSAPMMTSSSSPATMPMSQMKTKSDYVKTSNSIVGQPGLVHQTQNVKAAAENALSTMDLLCEQASAPWVDGMLLAGCLAYGLRLYDKALHWYQSILSQDSTHVEAMSNLGATLHALNRRDEALHYWSEAVRLRPSYFEAAEHLIGLLCATRRAKEAVELISYIESSLKLKADENIVSCNGDVLSDGESDAKSHTSSVATQSSVDQAHYDYDVEGRRASISLPEEPPAPGFGSSGYAIPGTENGRMLALVHAKGNMLYALGDNSSAASAFEDAILIATGQHKNGIRGLIADILYACLRSVPDRNERQAKLDSKDPVLLPPSRAEATARHMFPTTGELPGLEFASKGIASKAAVATTSNSLLSLAKIYQDAMSSASQVGTLRSTSTRDILALYYLSLSLQRSPSTANNVGILLASVQQSIYLPQISVDAVPDPMGRMPGVVPGSGVHLALMYYNYGLNLDNKHAHLYTNLGSLLKDIGQLPAAVKMYEAAVQCDPHFDIALANLANAVKDQGRVQDAIEYYKRAVKSSPDFAEAVCGLATALNSVCNWHGRGGVYADKGRRDSIHVDENGKLHDANRSYGWINRVVDIVDKQLKEGETWGCHTLTPSVIDTIVYRLSLHRKQDGDPASVNDFPALRTALESWSGKKWEGSRIVRLIERAIRRIGWQWYTDQYKHGKTYPQSRYARPELPLALSSPSAPTVLPFHTFTTPLAPKQIRQISQRNALRISMSTLRSAWLPPTVFPPPPPPNPHLVVGYVSSDFNNHPLAHLMQSVFGLHSPSSVHAICYATTASDNSIHRQQIEREAPTFYDCSTWSTERLVKQIVADQVHVLVNLNGYTRGARNDVFAARPAPIQMSFMGFAGTLGAEWCDYVLADDISVPPSTLSPWRRNVEIEDRFQPESLVEDADDWMYGENIIFTRHSFFCVDHKQSAPDADTCPPLPLLAMSRSDRDARWNAHLAARWALRQQLFPSLSSSAVILGNFNQLYKIDPSTFRSYLRILASVPNAILWLLRFPADGELNLMQYARKWAGDEIASRIVFTDVASKGGHIMRAAVVDLMLDTPECNAHTTAADVVWSGTPVLTWGRWTYKMCSRMCGSIVSSAFPVGPSGDEARRDLVVSSEHEYEQSTITLARGLKYSSPEVEHALGQPLGSGRGTGRLIDLRRMLWEGRWESRLFDTARWVRDTERAYWAAWRKWERGEGGDIWL
ncbi:hypothetical protein DV736_g5401, partial [Chaetothyriales sp. CBS 134916]